MKAILFRIGVVLGLLALIAVGHAAIAADINTTKAERVREPAVVGINWTGFYVDGFLGYGQMKGQSAVNGIPQPGKYKWSKTSFINSLVDYQADGVEFGGGLGYDYRLNQLLLIGVGGELSMNRLHGTGVLSNGSQFTRDQKFEGDIFLKLGVLFTEHTALYGKVGIDWSKFDTGVSGLAAQSETKQGWLGAVGIQHHFTSKVSAFIEGRYRKFSDTTITSGSTVVSVPNEIWDARVGLAWHPWN